VLTALPLLIPLVICCAPVAAQRGHDMTAQRRGRASTACVSVAVGRAAAFGVCSDLQSSRLRAAKEKCSALRLPDRASPHASASVPPLLAAETFWNQMATVSSSVRVALLTLTIGSLTSFTISRMRIPAGLDC